MVAPCVISVSPKLMVNRLSMVPLTKGSCSPVKVVCSWLSMSAVSPIKVVSSPIVLVM